MARERGTMVELLDQDKLSTACAEHDLQPLSWSRNALLRRVDGVTVVLSYEGVGSTRVVPGCTFLDTQNLDWQCLPTEAVEACRTGETRDLADFIRTFGSRLDVNHHVWRQWAAGEDR